MTLLITAGRGPAEVRRFVALLAEWLGKDAAQGGQAGRVTFSGDAAAPASALVEIGVEGERWVGSHVLVAALRGNNSRKRWFVRVTVAAEREARVTTVGDFEVFSMRSGGPGGQNVNKRATAVRVVDRESGLSVRASDQRSQARNRALAVERLTGTLLRREAVAEAEILADRRAEHDRIQRGAEDFAWRLDGKGRLVEQRRDRP